MIDLRRRSLLKAGALGAGAWAVPGGAQALLRGFTHGVASGEPRPDGVMLWTRYVPPDGGTAAIGYEVATDVGFGRIAARGEAIAAPEHDHCARPVVSGLAPDRWYYYRFRGADGAYSAIGRTRTLPEGRARRFRIAAFSCANKPFGWFNAYAHAAARNDIDLVVHLGDYIYEYLRGDYPTERDVVPGRPIDPAGEAFALDGYRARYASYRVDTDLQRLHQLFPALCIWDDHETANDSWKDGAENHQPDREGDWDDRKVAARRAFREWLPMSDEDYATYQIGDLLTLIRLEGRLVGRDRELSLAPVLAGATDLGSALAAFRDGPLADPSRSILGAVQEAWTAEQLRASVRSGTRWQLVAQQVVMGGYSTSTEATPDWLGPDPTPRSRQRVLAGIAAAKAGIGYNLGSWSGYPAARARFLAAAQEADANLVVLAGDSHNAWAFELANGGRPAGIEFATSSVSSPGLEWSLRGVSPDRVARSLIADNPELKWCDTAHRGYMIVDFTPDEVSCEWQLLDTVRERSTRAAAHSVRAKRGHNRFSAT